MVISETAECDKVKGHQLFLSIPIVPIFFKLLFYYTQMLSTHVNNEPRTLFPQKLKGNENKIH